MNPHNTWNPDPTPEEIAARAAEIRSEWSEREEWIRTAVKNKPATVMTCKARK